MKEVRIDCLGEACPIPLLKAQKKLAELEVGDVLIVETDHSCAIVNIPEWAMKMKLPYEIHEVGTGEWDIAIVKTQDIVVRL